MWSHGDEPFHCKFCPNPFASRYALLSYRWVVVIPLRAQVSSWSVICDCRQTLSWLPRLTLNWVSHGHASELYPERAQRIYIPLVGREIPVLFICITQLDSQSSQTLPLCDWLITGQRLAELSRLIHNPARANTIGLRIPLIEIYKWKLARCVSIWAVWLTKFFRQVNVSENNITCMPMTSRTRSSTDLHICLGCMSGTTLPTKDNLVWTIKIHSSTAKSHIWWYI
jgi:hypothetical protein